MLSPLMLHNTLTDRTEQFTPRENRKVKLFTCGPSVYRRQHLGNYRTYLFEEILQSYLEYSGFEVDRLINFTDVEDKAIEEARDKGVSIEQLRRPLEEAFFEECEMLKIRLPETIPRASTSVDAAVDLIKRLIDRGYAYRHEGEVFFDPLTYDGFGRLYGLDMSLWPDEKVRFRRDTYPGRQWNLGDFILWHRRRQQDQEVWWDTEIGQGRPSWNIQDAAMISKHLGFEIDIHTGGVDNLYRRHDYTLAIMEAASGKMFCPWWLHGGHLLVDGEKMSKSRDNVTYVEDLLKEGFYPRHIRFYLLYGPYRDDLDLRTEKMEKYAGYLDRVRRLSDSLVKRETADASETGTDLAGQMRDAFERAMNDNLNFAAAFDSLAEHIFRALQIDGLEGIPPKSREKLRAVISDADRVFGVLGMG